MGIGSPSSRFNSIVITAVFVMLAVSLLPLDPSPAIAGDRLTKLERQVRVMEGAIDDMLVDSPNFLVAHSSVTEGVDIEDYGVLFTFRSSLTGLGWDEHGSASFWPWNWKSKNKVYVIKGGKNKDIDLDDAHIIIRDGDIHVIDTDKDEKWWKKLIKDGDVEEIDDETYRAQQMKKYEAAKEELIEVLMDYGEILKGMPAGQTVRIAVRWHDLDLPKDKDINKLVLRASIDDLRSYGDGRISESEMRSRINIKES